jgi:hypothetical protein
MDRRLHQRVLMKASLPPTREPCVPGRATLPLTVDVAGRSRRRDNVRGHPATVGGRHVASARARDACSKPRRTRRVSGPTSRTRAVTIRPTGVVERRDRTVEELTSDRHSTTAGWSADQRLGCAPACPGRSRPKLEAVRPAVAERAPVQGSGTGPASPCPGRRIFRSEHSSRGNQ